MNTQETFNQDLLEMIRFDQIDSSLLTIKDYLRWAYSMFNRSDIFYGQGLDNAWDEASQLILSGLALPMDTPTELYDARLTASEKQTLLNLVSERLQKRIPVAYLTNSSWFCGLEFYVDERVLIPRSPIGELIHHHFRGIISHEPKRILDMCTGSGCIAVSCAAEFPEAEVDAVDLSIDALHVAEINIERHNLTHRVFPLQSDLFDRLPADKYDLIIANPPYVDAEDLSSMPQEFGYEPVMALEAGQDGLVLVKRILVQAADYLTDGGTLICEVGNSMVHLTEQYPDVPFRWLEFEHGGDGVFAVSKENLQLYRERFIA